MKNQLCFCTENASLLYISPYADYYITSDNKVFFFRRDTGYKISIECSSKDMLTQLINTLQTGTTISELSMTLNVSNIDIIKCLLEMCVRNGVIE